MTRRTVERLAALLIVLQMVMAPFAYAFAGGAPDSGCADAGTIHPWHADGGCGGTAHGSGSTHSTGHHHGPAPHRCHCVHAVSPVPITGTPAGAVLMTSEAGAIAGRLQGPAYPAPLYELLRPPR